MRILLILISFILFSCTTLKKINPNDNRSTLTNTSFSDMNGTYESDGSVAARTTLDFALTFKKYKRFDLKSKYYVALKVKDQTHIQTDIYKNDSLLKTKIIKGKIENGYFVFKTKKASPFYLIFNVFGNKTTRLGQLKSGDLTVDCRHFQVATLFIIPLTGGNDEEYNIIFRKQSVNP